MPTVSCLPRVRLGSVEVSRLIVGGNPFSAISHQSNAMDREAATEAINRFDRPAVGYKVLAAGRNDPAEAFGYALRRIKPTDAVCVGMYPGRRPDMVAENARLALEAMGRG